MISLKALCRWLIALLALTVLLSGGAATAQIPGYDLLGGQSGAEQSTPRQSTPPQSTPRQATPAPAQSTPTGSGQAGLPTAADYGRIAETVPDPMLDATSHAVGIFRARLTATIARLPAALKDIRTALAASSPTGKPGYFLGVALFAGLLLIIGRAFTLIFYVYVARRVLMAMQRTAVAPQGYVGKLPLLAYRVMLTLVGVAIAVGVATAVGLIFYQEHPPTLTTVIIVFAAYGMVLLIDTIWRMTLAPYLPEYRLPHLSDRDAMRLYGWLSAISAIGLGSMAFSAWMGAMRLASEVHAAITIVLSLLVVLLMMLAARVNRHAITGIILGGKPREQASWPQLLGAALWGPLLLLYLLFTWGDLSFRMIMGIEQAPFRLAAPYLIFVAGIIVYAIASYVIERVFARSREISEINAELDARRRAEEEAFQAEIRDKAAGVADAELEGEGEEEGGAAAVDADPIVAVQRPGMQTMEDLARRAASLFAIGAVAYALIRYWGGPEIFETSRVLDLVQDVVDILFLGYLVFHAVRIWIDQKIADEGGDEAAGPLEGEGGGAGATRLATILPLFRNFLLIVIVVSIALLLLVEFGVNVAPLFAGAGIVGLAIGFGSQTLVRDILSGAFFLMDDAFRKGEYVDVGDVKGTVEKISLRSFQLRHHLGMLHTIPFGEIQYLTNFSRDWVMMKLPMRLTYDTDIERVRKLVKKLGLQLLEDPEIGPKFIQPLKSQGVIQMDDSAMIVRVKFMTKPGEQWVLRKRVYHELRELFEREGIKFAHREVTVRIPGIDEKKGNLTEEETRAIGAAARRSVDQMEEEMMGAGPAGPADTR